MLLCYFALKYAARVDLVSSVMPGKLPMKSPRKLVRVTVYVLKLSYVAIANVIFPSIQCACFEVSYISLIFV